MRNPETDRLWDAAAAALIAGQLPAAVRTLDDLAANHKAHVVDYLPRPAGLPPFVLDRVDLVNAHVRHNWHF